MPITAKCTIEHGSIRLPSSLGLLDGMKVLVNIQPLPAKVSKKTLARQLSGSWESDASINQIFQVIEDDRHTYYGREVESQ